MQNTGKHKTNNKIGTKWLKFLNGKFQESDNLQKKLLPLVQQKRINDCKKCKF